MEMTLNGVEEFDTSS